MTAPPVLAPLYQGTKTLLAQPMSRGDYNTYRGWQVPADEDPSDAGYLVEYTDGGNPNDPRHTGYISWSPKDVFEQSYKPCGTHVDRMAIELKELQERIEKLTAFMFDPASAYQGLADGDKSLLNAQQGAMLAYQGVLNIRLNLAMGN